MIVRPLNDNDWKAYKEIRLRSLKYEEELFCSAFNAECGKPASHWKDVCRKTENQCMFGLFSDNKLIGVMKAQSWDGDVTGKTALWGSAYVDPEYRGKGYARGLYECREQWTTAHGFESVVMFIRDGNRRSTEIHLNHGAQLIDTKQMSWCERPPAPWNRYIVPLKQAALKAA